MTYEYLLLELGAVLRLRMALLFLCWPRQDVIFSAGSGTRHQAKKCAAQRIWNTSLVFVWSIVTSNPLPASSLTWYSIGVVDGDGKVSTEAVVQLAISMHGEMRDRVSLRLYLGCRPQDNYEMTCGQKRGPVDRRNGSSVCCQCYQPVTSTCGQMSRLVDSWMADLFVDRSFRPVDR